MINLVLCNNKGGVAKTMSAFNLSGYLNDIGLKVLLIDLDPQGNLSTAFGINGNEVQYTAYDVMSEYTISRVKKSEKDMKKYLINVRENIDLLPSNLTLEQANMNFVSELGKEKLLDAALKDVGRFYDVCIIDCSPNLSTLTINGLVAADYVFIPMKSGIFELNGSTVLAESIEKIKLLFNEDLKIGGVFLTIFDERNSISKEIAVALKETFGDVLMATTIRQSIKAVESVAFNKTIFEYLPKSNLAKDYTAFCKEVMKRTGILKPRKKKENK